MTTGDDQLSPPVFDGPTDQRVALEDEHPFANALNCLERSSSVVLGNELEDLFEMGERSCC